MMSVLMGDGGIASGAAETLVEASLIFKRALTMFLSISGDDDDCDNSAWPEAEGVVAARGVGGLAESALDWTEMSRVRRGVKAMRFDSFD